MDTFQEPLVLTVFEISSTFFILRAILGWLTKRKEPAQKYVNDNAQMAAECTSLLLTFYIANGFYSIQFAVAVLFAFVFIYGTRMMRFEREIRELQKKDPLPYLMLRQSSKAEIYAGIAFAAVVTLCRLFMLGYWHNLADIVLRFFPAAK